LGGSGTHAPSPSCVLVCLWSVNGGWCWAAVACLTSIAERCAWHCPADDCGRHPCSEGCVRAEWRRCGGGLARARTAHLRQVRGRGWWGHWGFAAVRAAWGLTCLAHSQPPTTTAPSRSLPAVLALCVFASWNEGNWSSWAASVGRRPALAGRRAGCAPCCGAGCSYKAEARLKP